MILILINYNTFCIIGFLAADIKPFSKSSCLTPNQNHFVQTLKLVIMIWDLKTH
ncbi:hypothetical protein Hanom_Chr03g00255351 [Helianthus anomalus]